MRPVRLTVHKLKGKCLRCGLCCTKVIQTTVERGDQIAPNTQLIRSRAHLQRVFREIGFTVRSIEEYRSTRAHSRKGGAGTVWVVSLLCKNWSSVGCSIELVKPHFCSQHPLHDARLMPGCGFQRRTEKTRHV